MIRVMVVEDEEQIRNILTKMIERTEDCKVVAASGNFATAISDFIRLRPEVVFMDIDLGGESGMECAKALTEVDPKVKIVFATAHSEYMADAFSAETTKNPNALASALVEIGFGLSTKAKKENGQSVSNATTLGISDAPSSKARS